MGCPHHLPDTEAQIVPLFNRFIFESLRAEQNKILAMAKINHSGGADIQHSFHRQPIDKAKLNMSSKVNTIKNMSD